MKRNPMSKSTGSSILSTVLLFCSLLPSIHSFTTVPFRSNCVASSTTARQRPSLEAFTTDDVQRSRRGSSNDDDSWIPTKDGNFIPNLPRRVTKVRTLEEYKREVSDEKDRIVCVRFYAPWCRACKRVAPAFRGLTALYPSVKFVEVPLSEENTPMVQGLGVPSFPYAHIYHPQAGLVEERKMNRKVFASFAKALKCYVDGGCSLDDEDKIALRSP